MAMSASATQGVESGADPDGLFEALRARLEGVLKRRHVALSSQEFVEILVEAATPAEPLTGHERAFLMQHADVSADDLSADALQRAAAIVEVSGMAADARAREEALTTAQAAELTGIAAANLRRLVGAKRLCTVGTAKSGSHLLPRWQFTNDGRVLPGIGDIVRALPVDYHPMDIAVFMRTSVEELGGRSPAEWLADGGAVNRVVALADERAWE